MKQSKKSKRIGLIIGISCVVMFVITLVWSELLMKDYGTVCGEYLGKFRSKVNYYYKFKYKIGDKTFYSEREGLNYNDDMAKYLDSVDCI